MYLSLASRMKLTGINQLWVADVAYIRLQREFAFLAVILDAFSRKVVGWQLDHTLGFGCRSRQVSERSRNGDLGPVWCIIRIADYSTLPAEYVNVLRQHQILPSMSRPANSYDNASCESFIKTLKREEIYANEI